MVYGDRRGRASPTTTASEIVFGESRHVPRVSILPRFSLQFVQPQHCVIITLQRQARLNAMPFRHVSIPLTFHRPVVADAGDSRRFVGSKVCHSIEEANTGRILRRRANIAWLAQMAACEVISGNSLLEARVIRRHHHGYSLMQKTGISGGPNYARTADEISYVTTVALSPTYDSEIRNQLSFCKLAMGTVQWPTCMIAIATIIHCSMSFGTIVSAAVVAWSAPDAQDLLIARLWDGVYL